MVEYPHRQIPMLWRVHPHLVVVAMATYMAVKQVVVVLLPLGVCLYLVDNNILPPLASPSHHALCRQHCRPRGCTRLRHRRVIVVPQCLQIPVLDGRQTRVCPLVPPLFLLHTLLQPRLLLYPHQRLDPPLKIVVPLGLATLPL
jgi:hypothetical protein